MVKEKTVSIFRQPVIVCLIGPAEAVKRNRRPIMHFKYFDLLSSYSILYSRNYDCPLVLIGNL